MRSTSRCRATRRSRRRSSPATSCRGSSMRADSSDGMETVEPKSVKKKLKQPSFASGVNRDDVYKGAEGLGVELDDHIRFVIEAMRPIAPELGLRAEAALAC